MSGDLTPFTDHITSEHSDKPKFLKMVSATLQPFADSKAMFLSAPFLFDLDNAVGQQLDVIGQWVGVSRSLSTPLTGVYFTLDGTGPGFDYGVWKGPYDPSTGLVLLPDEFFRLVIRTKILNNSWDGSKDSIYNLTAVLFSPSGYTYYIEDHGDLSISIGLLGATPPPPILIALLNGGEFDLKGITIRIASRIAQQGPIFSLDLDTLLFKGFDNSFWPVSS